MNVDKAKGMQLLFGKKSSVLKVDPCCVSGERFGCSFIQCTKCQRWIQCRRSDVPRQVRLLLKMLLRAYNLTMNKITRS